MFDVIVLGDRAGGATAAALLARRGRRVALIGCEPGEPRATRLSWLSRRAEPILKQIGLSPAAVRDKPIRAVRFYDARLDRHMTCRFQRAPAHIVQTATFEPGLVAAAVQAGAEHHPGSKVQSVAIEEHRACVALADGRQLDGAVLIATDPHHAHLARTGPRTGTAPSVRFSTAHGYSPGAAADSPAAPAVIVLGLGATRARTSPKRAAARGFGYILHGAAGASVGLVGPGEPAELLGRLERFVAALNRKGLIGADLREPVAESLPAGAALEMEAHVAKRSLLAGRAGGFVATVSGETLYPAMWSAALAADVIDAALTADSLQDQLGRFEAIWRSRMAEYLRLPNADLELLLPLVFANQRMADKMAAAFFAGQNL